jgi:hypothetical protein
MVEFSTPQLINDKIFNDNIKKNGKARYYNNLIIRCLACSESYVAIGMSRGNVLLYPDNLTIECDSNVGAVCSLEISHD